MLVRILLDVVQHREGAKGPGSVPPEILSKVFTLSAVLHTEHRRLVGLPIGDAILHQTEQLLAVENLDRPSPAAKIVVVDTLRTSQEMAHLTLSLGMPALALRAVRRFQRYLEHYGDPEHEVEPDGWLFELLLTYARVEATIASKSHQPMMWLSRAERHAAQAAEIVFEQRQLPVPLGLLALAQIIRIHLVRAHLADGPNHQDALDRVVTRQAEAERELEKLPATVDLDYRRSRLAIRLTAWQGAILRQEANLAGKAQAAAQQESGPWTLPSTLDEMESLVQATRQLGGGEDPNPTLAVVQGSA